jgi:hypothetical protein
MTRVDAIRLIVLALAATLAPLGLVAAEPAKAKTQPPKEEVELFDAIKAGKLDVQLIPKDSKQSTLVFKNKTKQPLNVKLPDVFAGVPVLAQAVNAPRTRNTTSSNNNANQGLGGGFGGGMMGGGMGGGMMGGGGGGFFNIPPEQVRKVKVATVCLEHGKREPRAAVPYEIRPLESFTDDTRVPEVLKLLANDKCAQRVAQAAAWHFANGMSWDELAAKERKRLRGPSEPYFSREEIGAALALAKSAEETAKKAADPISPGSLSQK